MGKRTSGSKAVETIRRLLAKIEQAHPDQVGVVAEMQELLIAVEAELSPSRPPAPRAGANTKYTVQKVNGLANLSEHRAGSQPLRVARDVFSAVVKTLTSEKGLAAEDIVEGVRAAMKVKPAEWQVRVVLRFLLSPQPPLLRRARARYAAADPATFPAAAEALWRSTTSS